MAEKHWSRRALLLAAAGAPLAAAEPAAKLKVCIFSKHLQFLDGEALADGAAEIGFDGIDITVRKGGHVEPQRVRQDLPPLVAIIRRRGLAVPMVTTDIIDADTPYAEDVLRVLADLDVHHYRWGGFKYDARRPIDQQLADLKPRVARLAALNSKYKTTAMYHTHSGINLVGASIWDLYLLVKDFNPEDVGVNYDIGHATVEGGFGGWRNSLRICGPHLRGVAVKDFLWAKDAKGNWRPEWRPLGEGMVAFPEFFGMLAQTRFSGPLQLHFEYPLGGADAGKRNPTMSRADIFAAMKRDLARLRAWFKQANLA